MKPNTKKGTLHTNKIIVSLVIRQIPHVVSLEHPLYVDVRQGVQQGDVRGVAGHGPVQREISEGRGRKDVNDCC